MSYGVYSEVYFAQHEENPAMIKIGETTNARRRGRQLEKEGFIILESTWVNGDDKCDRRFVESFLRSRIATTGHAAIYKEDYFICDNETTANWIKSEFMHWVEEANRILTLMWCGGSISLDFGASRKPIPPKGWEYTFERAYAALQEEGEYNYQIQCKYAERDNYQAIWNEGFGPFGYTCTYKTSTSWTTFTIKRA